VLFGDHARMLAEQGHDLLDPPDAIGHPGRHGRGPRVGVTILRLSAPAVDASGRLGLRSRGSLDH
jgi:hypothetical protein